MGHAHRTRTGRPGVHGHERRGPVYIRLQHVGAGVCCCHADDRHIQGVTLVATHPSK